MLNLLAFNRTSMESKRFNKDLIGQDLNTFNRTSMESKRIWIAWHHRKNDLLIEPVWNRNNSLNRARNDKQGPFNRTSMESKLSSAYFVISGFRLLIEPVWNRNTRVDGISY